MSNILNLISEETFTEKLDVQNALLAAIASKSGGLTVNSWADVQKIVRMGLADKVFSIGDQLACQKGTETLVWDIIGFDCDTPYDKTKIHSMTLQLRNCLTAMQYDSQEALYYAETELPAGTYNFTLLAGYDVNAGGGKTLSFTLEQAVPRGGVIVFPWISSQQSTEIQISTYENNTATEAIETVPVTEGAMGTALEVTNHTHRIRQGSNNWKESAVRQFLNSSDEAGSVWTPQTVYDRPPSWAASASGFFKGLDEEFLAVIGEVEKVTNLNNKSDGGGNETSTERFFLLAASEVYGGNANSNPEGTPYPYYSENSDLAEAGSGEDKNRIKYYANGSAAYAFLRSASPATAHCVRSIYPSGKINDLEARTSVGIAPACCVI